MEHSPARYGAELPNTRSDHFVEVRPRTVSEEGGGRRGGVFKNGYSDDEELRETFVANDITCSGGQQDSLN